MEAAVLSALTRSCRGAVLDQGLCVKVRELSKLLRLDLRVAVSRDEPGLQVADFVAGALRFLRKPVDPPLLLRLRTERRGCVMSVTTPACRVLESLSR